MADFDLFKVKIINRYFLFLEKGLTLTKQHRMTIARQNRFSRFGCTLIKERKKLKNKLKKNIKNKRKKGRTLICWVCVSPSGKIFPKPNVARLVRSMA